MVDREQKLLRLTDANYSSLMKAPQVYDLPYIQDGDAAGKFRTALYWERGFELAFEGQRKIRPVALGYLGRRTEVLPRKYGQNTERQVCSR